MEYMYFIAIESGLGCRKRESGGIQSIVIQSYREIFVLNKMRKIFIRSEKLLCLHPNLKNYSTERKCERMSNRSWFWPWQLSKHPNPLLFHDAHSTSSPCLSSAGESDADNAQISLPVRQWKARAPELPPPMPQILHRYHLTPPRAMARSAEQVHCFENNRLSWFCSRLCFINTAHGRLDHCLIEGFFLPLLLQALFSWTSASNFSSAHLFRNLASSMVRTRHPLSVNSVRPPGPHWPAQFCLQ